jgi:hypothetical protein
MWRSTRIHSIHFLLACKEKKESTGEESLASAPSPEILERNSKLKNNNVYKILMLNIKELQIFLYLEYS